MIRYDDLVVGAELGACSLRVDDAMLEGWNSLFVDEQDDGTVPPGLAAAVFMRAYADVVTPRPPGNVHGAQRFTINRLPKPGQLLQTTVRCAGKEIKRERKWVQFEATTVDESGASCFSGLMTIAWAA